METICFQITLEYTARKTYKLRYSISDTQHAKVIKNELPGLNI